MSTAGFKILTFGAATQDVFLSGKSLAARRDVRSRDWVEQFPLGAKLEIEGVAFDTGGGATNAAVTFARQGFEVGYVGKVGLDPAGTEVLRVLQKEGIATDHVSTDPRLGTSYSTLLVANNGERTILNYRGASHDLQVKEIGVRGLEADWFYITSLAGNLKLLEHLLKHANRHGIQVALDPGAAELVQVKKLRSLLPLVTVLKANLEELSAIFPAEDLRQVVQQAAGVCPYVVGTNGGSGSYAAYSGRLYKAGIYQKVKVTDRTGAGDAFGSGFVAAIAKGQTIDEGLTLGSANATAVVQKIGAKAGILKTDRIKRMKIQEVEL